MENKNSGLKGQIEREVTDYLTRQVYISKDVDFSQATLVRRIGLFETKTYPNGKFDSQGDYKFWYDIISPRIDAEVKNIDFDTKDVGCESDETVEQLPCLIVNLSLGDWMKMTGQAEEINSAIEEGSGWGNVVWKKVRGSYERVNLRNIFITNQTAECLDDTAVIERHQLQQSDLREMSNIWNNVEDAIKDCGSDSYKASTDSMSSETTTPYYDVFERNGEVKLSDLKKENESMGPVKDGDENIYVLAKVVVVATKSSGGGSTSIDVKRVLYAKKISKMPYKEYHRGRYKGRWWREGLYEILFDYQVRANQIGNQMAKGLEWASKQIFYSNDKLLVQNIITDLKNGDIIKASQIQKLPVRIEGFDQLLADWNRNIQEANAIANSQEIIQGASMPSGMPFRLGALLNQNANKLFDFIREKFAIPMSQVFEEYVGPKLIKDLSAKRILKLSGDPKMMDRLRTWIVNEWYLENLPILPPHNEEIGMAIKAEKSEELKRNPELVMKGIEKAFKGFKPRFSIVITGENSRKPVKLESYATFIALEQDPVRRRALIERAMKLQDIDISDLPKTEDLGPQPIPPERSSPLSPPQATPQSEEIKV